jgi:hypothetical protein
MTLPRTVAEVLSDHVVFEVECIDRMYLNVYVPPIASTAPLAKVTDRFTAEVHRFAEREAIPWVSIAWTVSSARSS